MLRFKILASAVPLLILGFFARSEWLPGPHPCIAIADTSVQISDMPWVADLHVAFTDDPKLATVRVQLADSAEAADFAVIDDADSAETGSSCARRPSPRARRRRWWSAPAADSEGLSPPRSEFFSFFDAFIRH